MFPAISNPYEMIYGLRFWILTSLKTSFQGEINNEQPMYWKIDHGQNKMKDEDQQYISIAEEQ